MLPAAESLYAIAIRCESFVLAGFDLNVMKVIRTLFGTQLRLNMMSGVVTMALRTVILLLAYPAYLHFLGYGTYGIWVVLATVLGFAQLGELGIGEAIIKLVAEAYGRKDIDEIRRYITSSLAILTVSGLVLLMCILIWKERIVDLFRLTGENRVTVIRVLPYIGALSIYVCVVQISTATLSGLGRMDLTNYIELSGQVTSLCMSVLLLWLNWGVMALIVGNAASCMLVHLTSMLLAWRVARLTPFPKAGFSRESCRRLIHYGGGVMGITVLSMLSDPFSKLVVARYTGLPSVAVYDVAGKMAVQIKTLFNPCLRALMPEVSRLQGGNTQEGRARIRAVNLKAARLLVLVGGGIYIIMLLGAEPMLLLWLRKAFVDALPPVFRILLSASFVGLLGGCAYYTLMGLGQVRSGLVAHLLKAGTNVGVIILALLFWQPLTVSTVAWASLAASAAATLYLLVKMTEVVLRSQSIPSDLPATASV